MLACTQHYLLNEAALNSLPEEQRSAFIYEWLCYLDQILGAAQQVNESIYNDFQQYQSRIIEQLLEQIHLGPGPPIRRLISRTLTSLCISADPSTLFTVIYHCHEVLKSKDDLPKLSGIVILGVLYERLSRSISRLHEESIGFLLTSLKNGDSQMRYEILFTLKSIINGVNSISISAQREISKSARTHLSDRVMAVRSASASCLTSLISQSSFMYTTEFEANLATGFRSFDGSNYSSRRRIAHYLAQLLMAYLNAINKSTTNSTRKVEDIFNYLANGFLRGTIRCFKLENSEHQDKLTIVPNEIRLGVSHTYIEWIRLSDSSWLEEHLSIVINHLLELIGHSSKLNSIGESIHSRQCVTLILHSVLNSRPDEHFKVTAIKEMLFALKRYLTKTSLALINNSMESSSNSLIQSYESSFKSNSDSINPILILILNEIRFLIRTLDCSIRTIILDRSLNFIETLFNLLNYPTFIVRLLTAWCFRSITDAQPVLIVSLIDQCLEKMKDSLKISTSEDVDTLSGYSLALEALLGSVHRSSLGVPLVRVKMIFNFADNLLRTTTKSIDGQDPSIVSRLILQRIHTAWHLISACCSFNLNYVKDFLPRLSYYWTNVFPRSSTEFQLEQQRGDPITWSLSLNQRAVSLCSMISLFKLTSIDPSNPLVDELHQKISIPIGNAILILHNLPNLMKHFGSSLKPAALSFRFYLYQLLICMPIELYEQHLKVLLKALTTEMTLFENPLNSGTSLLKSICHEKDYRLLESQVYDLHDQLIDDDLQIHSVQYSDDVEIDESFLYSSNVSLTLKEPMHTALIDASIILFSKLFPCTTDHYRSQILQRFLDLFKLTKGLRQETLQINTLAAIGLSLKNFSSESNRSIPIKDEHLRKSLFTLIVQSFSHSNGLLRTVASETFSRLIQIVTDENFRTDVAQFSLDRLKEARDVSSRTGYSLALGSFYRYIRTVNVNQTFNPFISILFGFARDSSNSLTQIWALHALSLLADYVGQRFRHFMDGTITLILNLLLCSAEFHVDLLRACARLLMSFIRIFGSELQLNTKSMSKLRNSCIISTDILLNHPSSIVKFEAIRNIEQLHYFAPRYVGLSKLLVNLLRLLTDDDINVRRNSIRCLKKLFQNEPKDVYENINIIFINFNEQSSFDCRTIEEYLFQLLDKETDVQLCDDYKSCLMNILENVAMNSLAHWFELFGKVLVEPDESSTVDHSSSFDEDTDEDEKSIENEQFPTEIPRFCSSSQISTKIFVLDCVDKLIEICDENPLGKMNFDLILAEEHRQSSSKNDFLVFYLSTLINFSLIGSRSSHSRFRCSALKLFKRILTKFSSNKENFRQRKMFAALRPSFSRETSSETIDLVCQISRLWIRNQMANGMKDFRRTQQIFIVSLEKFTQIRNQQKNVEEFFVTSEILSILQLWADFFHFYVQQENSTFFNAIRNDFDIFIYHWLSVLIDFSLLNFNRNSIRQNQNERDGHFFSFQSDLNKIRSFYRTSFPSFLRAISQWFVQNQTFSSSFLPHRKVSIRGRHEIILNKFISFTLNNKQRIIPETKEDLFDILLGCCCQSVFLDPSNEDLIDAVIFSLKNLLQIDISSTRINSTMSIELLRFVQRIFLVSENVQTKLKIIPLIELIFERLKHISDSTFPTVGLEVLSSFLFSSFPTFDLENLTFSKPIENEEFCSSTLDLICQTISTFHRFIDLFQTEKDREKFVSLVFRVFLCFSFAVVSTEIVSKKLILTKLDEFFNEFFLSSIDKVSGEILTKFFVDRFSSTNDDGFVLRWFNALIVHCPSITINDELVQFYRNALENRPSKSNFQCLRELFQIKNKSRRDPWIRKLTPILIVRLTKTKNEEEIIEILNIFKLLLVLVDSNRQAQLASLIIPIYRHFQANTTSSNSKFSSTLNELVEKKLTID